MTATAEAPAHTVAKRGMVLVHEITRRDYIIGEGPREHTDCELGIVTSITRDGLVKRYRNAWGGEQDGPAGRMFRGRVHLAPGIDPEPAMAAAKAHCWPGHPGQPKPYGSLAEVREALRPFRQ